MIGAGGERSALRVVAEHADIWASPTFTAADFRRKSAVLDDHCATVGRSPAEITRSAQVFFTAQEPSARRLVAISRAHWCSRTAH